MATCYAPDAQFDDEACSLRGHKEGTCCATSPKPRVPMCGS
jgi:hypothetical protein